MASQTTIANLKDTADDIFLVAARRVLERCDELARCSDEAGKVTRLFCSPAMHDAHGKLRTWMEEAECVCRIDGVANLIGRFECISPHPSVAGISNELNFQSEGTLLIGSHLDTVINAGKYDGVLGVLMGLALVEIAQQFGRALPFSIDVIAFSEEEGVRFALPYIGSLAMAGKLSEGDLQCRDAQGVTLAEALREFGGESQMLLEAGYRADNVVAYIEPHIEQGPVLEARNLPVGVVTGIAGQTRACLRFAGRAGHAGTVNMAERQDALTAAAEFILAVEKVGRAQAGLVATVGQLNVSPNVANVIPEEVDVRLDVRHAEDTIRVAAVRELIEIASRLAEKRNIKMEALWINEKSATHFDSDLMNTMADSIREAGQCDFRLASGAGHDAAVIAECFPTAMLFMRCAGGISHHPDESVDVADVAIALDVLFRFVEKLASKHRLSYSACIV